MPEQAVEVFIAVGANIDPEQSITRALGQLAARVRVTGVSTFYRTAPLARPGQPPFLNGVWRIETSIPPRPLKFDHLRAIEQCLGRIRTEDRYAPRTIDLDILLHGDTVIDEPDLKLPDPDIYTRPFVQRPLLELHPDLVLPDTGRALADVTAAAAMADLQPMKDFTQRLRQLVAASDRP